LKVSLSDRDVKTTEIRSDQETPTPPGSAHDGGGFCEADLYRSGSPAATEGEEAQSASGHRQFGHRASPFFCLDRVQVIGPLLK
jgi:hypothetical protein